MSISSNYSDLSSSFLKCNMFVHFSGLIHAVLYHLCPSPLFTSIQAPMLDSNINFNCCVICDLLTQNIFVITLHPFRKPRNFIAAIEQFLVMFYGLVCNSLCPSLKLYKESCNLEDQGQFSFLN